MRWALGWLLWTPGGLLSAADMHVADIRTQGGPMLAEVTFESQTQVYPAGGGAPTTSSSAEHDHVLALREGIWGSRGRLGTYGGILWGGGFAVSHYYFNSAAGRTRIENPVVDGTVAYGYAFTSWLHAEIGPILGGGFSLLSEEPSIGRIDNRSRFWEYGVRIGAFATIGNAWQAGLELPTMVGRSRPKMAYEDASGNVIVTTQDVRFHTNGAMLSLGMHF